VLQCVSVLQCVTACCSVSLQSMGDVAAGTLRRKALRCVAVCCSMSQCIAVCCSMLQCIAACCNVLQCGFAINGKRGCRHATPQGTEVCCSVLPVCCNLV